MPAATTVAFVRGGTTVNVNGPSSATDVDLHPMWVTGLSASHSRWVYRTTTTKKRVWAMKLDSVTAAQKAALDAFFTDTAKGPELPFVFVHTDGASYGDVYFADATLRWERINQADWSVMIHLELPGNTT